MTICNCKTTTIQLSWTLNITIYDNIDLLPIPTKVHARIVNVFSARSCQVWSWHLTSSREAILE